MVKVLDADTNLKSFIENCISLKDRFYSISVIDHKPEFKNFWMVKEAWRLNTYVAGVIRGVGKQKCPICDVDPSLNQLLNKQNYFSSSIGLSWAKQKERIFEQTDMMETSTVLFADAYNIQKAKFRSRLWTLNFNPVGKENVEAYVIFNHCTILPMLPYEIAGIATVIWDYLRVTNKHLQFISWYFHSISTKALPKSTNICEYEEFDIRDAPPTEEIAKEMLKAERMLNINPQIRPAIDVPADMYFKKYMDDVAKWYQENSYGKNRINELLA